jgi:hypothetical protein
VQLCNVTDLVGATSWIWRGRKAIPVQFCREAEAVVAGISVVLCRVRGSRETCTVQMILFITEGWAARYDVNFSSRFFPVIIIFFLSLLCSSISGLPPSVSLYCDLDMLVAQIVVPHL